MLYKSSTNRLRALDCMSFPSSRRHAVKTSLNTEARKLSHDMLKVAAKRVEINEKKTEPPRTEVSTAL